MDCKQTPGFFFLAHRQLKVEMHLLGLLKVGGNARQRINLSFPKSLAHFVCKYVCWSAARGKKKITMYYQKEQSFLLPARLGSQCAMHYSVK